MKKKDPTEFEQMRKELGWSRLDMSRKMGIPIRTIEYWEQHRSNPPDYVKRLVLKEMNEFLSRK